ncbi:MAG: hypothetical protein ABI551_13930 [Polyangiaceae bacterium]
MTSKLMTSNLTPSMVDGRWSMVDGRWSMVDGRWSMVEIVLSLSRHV